MEDVKTRYRVEGMDCAGCALKVDRAVRRADGVRDVAVSVTAGTMTVTHDGTTDLDHIEAVIAGLGYRVQNADPASGRAEPDAPAHRHREGHGSHEHHHERGPHGHDHGPLDGPWYASGKARLALLSGLAFAVAYAVGHFVPAMSGTAFLLSLLVGLVPVAGRAFAAARAGTPFSIETLMVIAASGAVFIDATEEAAMVFFLFLLGELLEGIASTRARASIRALSDLVPKQALLETDGGTRAVPAEELLPEQIILVRPGDRIAADGVILSGESGIDEAPVTGESVPVRKGEGAAVFAGTVNGEAALRVSVTASARDNTIARVIRLVEEAQEAKAPTERFIDRFSRYYTPAVLLVGILVAVIPPLMSDASWSLWLYKGLALLLIGCPCALVISTPAAIAAALSAGARSGLLLKGGAVLERLKDVDVVAFDKTGTLTQGRPVVTDIIAFDGTEEEVLRLAAALEAGSGHPLALAILKRAEGMRLPAVEGNTAIGGKGIKGMIEGRHAFLGSVAAVEAEIALPIDPRSRIAALHGAGKTVSVLLVGGRLTGALALRDEPRADAAKGLAQLSRLGIHTLMLTGDNYLTAQAIGSNLGMDVRAELLPEDKQRIIGDLRQKGHVVAKVGDGINDAPALAAADIGIAMGGGSDVALETADAAILNGRVGDVARMIGLSRDAMANIRQNIAIALGLKLVFLVTTLLGVTGLWPAILADTGATVLVTMNALRLLSVRASAPVASAARAG
jgi:Cd2+/Zn2+-exporting ATPase